MEMWLSLRWVMVVRSQVFSRRNAEKLRSHSHDETGNTNRSFSRTSTLGNNVGGDDVGDDGVYDGGYCMMMGGYGR